MNERADFAPLKIMIVDDHDGWRELMRGFFPPPQYEVEECADGVEALSACRRFRPDWVLMDFAMKEMDGVTATQQILAELPSTRILIVTEHLEAALSAAASQVGARGFVAKDNLSQLRDIIRAPGAQDHFKREAKRL